MSSCQNCGKVLASPQSLWNHKQRCQRETAKEAYDTLGRKRKGAEKQRAKEEIIWYSEDDDDCSSVELEPIDTSRKAKLMALVDNIVNRPQLASPPSHVIAEVFQEGTIPAKTVDNTKNLNSTASKGKGLFLKGKGLDDEEETDSDDGKEEENACKKEKEKALRKLVNARVRKPKRKLMKLLRDLKEDDVDISHLEELVKDFLESEEKEINQDLYDALGMLKTSSKTIEIEMMLKEIEQENYRLNTILYRLEQADPQDIPSLLQSMKRDELISEELYETLLEKPYSYLEIIELLKEPKTGKGVMQYLPGSPNEMIDKLALLIGEFTSGNTTVKEQIKALLERMFETDTLLYHEYKTSCEKLGICPKV